MNYWIFIVTDHREHGLKANDVLSQRLKDNFWGLGEGTQNRKTLEKGDQVVFYMGTPVKCFVASATLSGAAFELSRGEQDELSHDSDFYRSQFGVRLEQISCWDEKRPIEALISALDFIKNKQSWGTYLQGGVRGIEEKDFRTITQRGSVAPETRPTPEDLEDEAEFALENHLEDFIDQNWNSIDFGSTLGRYVTDGENGRQFSAGPWNIDFLSIDKNSGDLVVVELKRGRTSDATVGQILRYIGWAKRNLAKPGQSVRGIIIAKETDEALRYAVADQANVIVLEYRVDFKLSPAPTT